MKLGLRILSLLLLLAGTLGEDGFNLLDALGDDDPTLAPVKEPVAPVNPKPKSDDTLDLLDAFGPDEPTVKPKQPEKPDSDDGFGFDLTDALGPDTDPKPDKPAIYEPGKGGGDNTLDDSDLFDLAGGDYKPEGGNSGGHGGGDSGYNPQDDQPKEGSGQIAGIVSAIGVALAGAAGSYFAYQKKKLCFKLQGGADPESGKMDQGTHSDPQVLSNLLRTN